MRKLLSLFVVISFVFGLLGFIKPVFAGGGWTPKKWIQIQIGNPTASVEGKYLAIEAAPYIKEGRTMVPAVELLNQIGESAIYDVNYDTVKISVLGKTVKFIAGAKIATVTINLEDDQQASGDYKLDVAPEIINSIMYVPLYFVADCFSYLTTWNPKDKSIYLDSPFSNRLNTVKPSSSSSNETEIIKIWLQIGNIKGTINNTRIILCDAAPFIKNDRTMLPIREVLLTISEQVAYNEFTHTISVKRDGVTYIFEPNNPLVVARRDNLKEEKIKLDAAPEIRNSRLFVPYRFIAELYGFEVFWEASNKSITLLKFVKTDTVN